MMMNAEARWGRLATGLLWLAALFGALTLYGIYDHDDWRGVVMTAAPGAMVLGLWYLARARWEYLATGEKPSLPIAIASSTILVGGLVCIFVAAALRPPPERREQQQVLELEQLEMVDYKTANGDTFQAPGRKQPTECPAGEELQEVPHPNRPGETIRFCAPKPATP